MRGLIYTLLGDGPSDRLLQYPIEWCLRAQGVGVELSQWADLRTVNPPPSSLSERARVALDRYPAEILFVHRDAERESAADRAKEIQAAITGVTRDYVAVVPVRMTEAWLLHDEAAIRRASGNPHGRVPLRLPAPSQVEEEADPKDVLLTALLRASEAAGRRLKKQREDFPRQRARTAELIADYGPLTAAPAFADFMSRLSSALQDLGFRPGRGR